jgi:hypothetical protein
MISIVVMSSATEAAETERQKVKVIKEKSGKKSAKENAGGNHGVS